MSRTRLGDINWYTALYSVLPYTQQDPRSKQHGNIVCRGDDCRSGNDEHHACPSVSRHIGSGSGQKAYWTALPILGRDYLTVHISDSADDVEFQISRITIIGPIQKLAQEAMDMVAKISWQGSAHLQVQYMRKRTEVDT